MAVSEEASRLYDDALIAHARGELETVSRLLADALARTPGSDLTAAIHHLQGRLLLQQGAPLRAYELLVTESAAVEARHPRRAAAMLADAALFALVGGEHDVADRTATHARELARRRAPELEPALVLTHELIGTFTEDAATAADAVVVALEHSGPEDLVAEWELFLRPASILFWLEEYDRARVILEELLHAARGFGLRALLPTALDTLAACDVRTGHWARADARSAEALRIARQLDLRPQAASCLTTLAGIAAARGDVDACRAYAHDALDLAEMYMFVEPWARMALASLALSQGDAQSAIVELEHVVDLSAGIDPAITSWHRELVEAYVRVDRRDEARAVAEELAARSHSVTRPGIRALVAHCLGLTSDSSLFADHFEEALHWYRKTDAPFFRARTNFVYGVRLRRAHRTTEGKTQLELALATFERLGARLWAERARTELSSGRHAVRGPAALRDVLTPHELEVALLVSGGATNKEASAALFVSPKTIDYHLASIYRKLELRSRTELAAMVAREER